MGHCSRKQHSRPCPASGPEVPATPPSLRASGEWRRQASRPASSNRWTLALPRWGTQELSCVHSLRGGRSDWAGEGSPDPEPSSFSQAPLWEGEVSPPLLGERVGRVGRRVGVVFPIFVPPGVGVVSSLLQLRVGDACPLPTWRPPLDQCFGGEAARNGRQVSIAEVSIAELSILVPYRPGSRSGSSTYLWPIS